MKGARSVISFFRPKECSLYFDHVIPFGLSSQLVVSSNIGLVEQAPDLVAGFESLVPPELASNKEFLKLLFDANYAILMSVAEKHFSKNPDSQAKRSFENELLLSGFSPSELGNPKNVFRQSVTTAVEKFHLHALPVEISESGVADNSDDAADADLAILLPNLKLIDADRIGWKQISEFRKDKTGRDRLRKFRLFALQNYSGKSKSFVEDDIQSRIFDYAAVVKEWGFETRLGVVNTLLSSKVIQTGAAGSFVALLMGEPLSAIIASGTAATIEIGKLGVELARRRAELRKVMRENPFSYFEYAKTKLKK